MVDKMLTLDRRTLVIGGIAVLSCLAVYAILFAQAPIAHDTFHEVRHALGLSCH